MRKKWTELSTSTKAVIVCCILLIIFTATMISMFNKHDHVPDSLVYCFYGALTGEAGVLGWIKTAKIKNVEYEREKAAYERMMADRARQEEEENNNADT